MSVTDAQASISIDASQAARSQCRTAWVAMGLVVAAFVLLWPTTASLMVRWQDTVHRTYTHGYLIVALSLWLIWRERAHLAAARTSVPGFASLIAGVLMWVVAWRAGVQIVHQALLPALVLSAVLTCCGRAVARQLLLPVLYLYCAVPVWDALNPLLQWISVFAVRTLLVLGDIPAYFEGNRFQLPAGSFEIADGCSGLHFFVVAFSISVLYGAINRDTVRTRLKLVAFAVLLAALTNWARIFIIVLAGHLTDMQHSLIRGEHYTFGWFMFAGAMTIFFLVVRRWPVAPPDRASRQDHPQGAPALTAFLATLGVFAIVPLWSALDDNRASGAIRPVLSRSVSGWMAQDATASWRPVFGGADLGQHVAYRSEDGVVEGFVATYLWQEQGKEIAGYRNSTFGDMRAGRAPGNAAAAQWQSARAVDASGTEWQVLYTYVIDQRSYSSLMHAQLSYGVRSLFSAPLSSVIVLRSPCAAGCERAALTLQRFVAAAALP